MSPLFPCRAFEAPSPQRPWPPPCSLCKGRSVGAEGLRRGEWDKFAPSCSVTWEVPGGSKSSWIVCLYGGRQFASLVGVLHANGQPMRRTPDEDGAHLVAARRRQERTCPELVGSTLVVLASRLTSWLSCLCFVIPFPILTPSSPSLTSRRPLTLRGLKGLRFVCSMLVSAAACGTCYATSCVYTVSGSP